MILDDEHGGQAVLSTPLSVETRRHGSFYNGQYIGEDKVRRRLGDTYEGARSSLKIYLMI